MKRRDFLLTSGTLTAGSLFTGSLSAMGRKNKKKKVALVGTGIRGISMWGRKLVDEYSNYLEFVALCDVNPGRLNYAQEYMGIKVPVYTDFDKMVRKEKIDSLIVTTVDSTHHEFIIKGLQNGLDVITEKPMTTDEDKCQAILDAEKKSGKKVIVTFNYRYAPLFTKIKEILAQNRVGKITSADFHWYLNTYHGASYFRRWHGIRDKGGTLLVHKSTHHFDLMNWFLDSEPEEVFAYGDLEHYGANNEFRGDKCRGCQHKETCEYYWDITKNERYMKLYVANEKFDGYIRDNCLWRKEIDIYDKMSVNARYANNVSLNYSLTTYSPYEGWRIAFNGTEGRVEAWADIPWLNEESVNQAEKHKAEMDQNSKMKSDKFDSIMVMDNFGDYEQIKVPKGGGGHGGGDKRLLDRIWVDPSAPDPLGHSAGTRDGSMSILLGIAARKSIESGKPIKVEDLTELKPREKRGGVG